MRDVYGQLLCQVSSNFNSETPELFKVTSKFLLKGTDIPVLEALPLLLAHVH